MATGLSASTIQRPAIAVQEASNISEVLTNQVRMMEKMKSVYQADQQLKLLNLQVEVETLLQQLQNLKQQRSTEDTEISSQNI
ncbi:hypothetical protein NIES2119_20945 [[Phormidium ambiguum] IAM M-71]|uniref:Uncharacterized protein n=1 Tax=[Phormidium ambiguum] IAM M-71 TaxID=454136 RepID=A0A1U7IE51_9CYAN|nr:hypothetical protein [Phormidium ambiguum]OKH35242.1 hypothetical protein NIES2119_20945 [Phormidium ambiguum IAM M-71]